MAQWLGFPVVDKYKDLDLRDLPLNHAYVIVNTTVENVSVYGVDDNCFNCPYKLQKHLTAHKEIAWEVDTSVQTTWTLLRTEPIEYMDRNYPSGLLCVMRPTFHEYGVYRLNVGQCEVRPEIQPVHTFLPLLLCSLLLLITGLCYAFIKFLLKRKRSQVQGETDKSLQICMEKRLEENNGCLPVFRGFLLSLIIFTTTGGGGYPIFNNEWKGLSWAECIFFGYVWTIGVNIPFVMKKAFQQQTKCCIMRDIIVRALFIIVLGTVIDSTVGNRHTSHFSMWCPLLRIGIAYFIAASVYVLTVQKSDIKSKNVMSHIAKNIITLMWCWIIAAFLLSVMIILMTTLISFNCLSNVDLENTSDEIMPDGSENCNNAVTQHINKIFVADPEKTIDVNSYFGFSRGVLGIMSTILHMMIGLKAGVIYLHHEKHSDKIKLWSFWATVFGVGGILFGVASCLSRFNLWPVTAILLTSTATLITFIITYVITEVYKVTSSTLTSAGVTSIAVLCGHLLFSESVPLSWQMSFNNHAVYLIQNMWIVFVWLTVGVILMKKKVRFDI